ncbi:MAG: hypothetical protein LBH68_03050 [Bifidobacteriaceae bacterium]|jgi:hypothetical protein|nr:hypothetical protein [Bifidobacteriaceae bacterium]
MTTPEQQPAYGQQQPAAGYYQQPGQQQPYGYAAPKGPSPIAGGVWGIILMGFAGALILVGLISLLVFVIVDIPRNSMMMTECFLVPGFVAGAIFLLGQVLANAKKDK